MIIYEGPSTLDGAPLVAIATTKTDNRKTGDMIQTWILRSDLEPTAAIKAGKDSSICGGCFHRGAEGRPRTCYVNVGQAPLAVYRAYKRGSYPRGTLPNYKPVRLGAYGDPTAVPFEVWEPALSARKRAGYTHQWRTCDQRFQGLLQASCDSPAEAMEAARKGWHTFLVEPHDFDPEVHFTQGIECLSDAAGISCAKCGVCDGTKSHVWIRAHGTARRFATA